MSIGSLFVKLHLWRRFHYENLIHDEEQSYKLRFHTISIVKIYIMYANMYTLFTKNTSVKSVILSRDQL